MSRLRVLYLMHVDWDWIRQRPHHLAEGLAARHDVEVHYVRSWRRSTLVRNDSPVARRPMLPLPLRRRLSLVAAADQRLQRALVRRAVARFRPDVVWITHPLLEPLVPDPLPHGAVLVYDCMDDAAGFPAPRAERARFDGAEARLAGRASLTLASSERLAGLLVERGFPRARVELVRNAGAVEPLDAPPPPRAAGEPLRALYFGTIAEWLDLDAILHALEAVPELHVELVGPRDAAVPRHPRLRVRPPVAHGGLAALAAAAHVLLVPFRRTPLVEAVDPVKLYEYVAYGRDVVCLRWPEVERFGELVHLYDDGPQLGELLGRIARGELRCAATPEQRGAFVRRNRWADRVEQVERALARATSGRWGNAA